LFVIGRRKSNVKTSIVLAIIAMVLASPFAMRGASASKAPEFSLPTAEGTTYSSTAHKGRRIVISFYKSYY
jgi:hypothetical protein